MAGFSLPASMSWRRATVVELLDETARAKSIVLDIPAWPGHRPGQSVDVRLTRAGRQVQRTYSIASAPEDGFVVLTVQRIRGGEVSEYLLDELDAGDTLELQGPAGSDFVWEASCGGPLLLVAESSGIVPLRSMLRHRAAAEDDTVARVIYSASSLDDVIYREELLRMSAYEEIDIRLSLTQRWPPGWSGHCGQIDRTFLHQVAWPAEMAPRAYVCGPGDFVERIAHLLTQADHDPRRIKTEPFG